MRQGWQGAQTLPREVSLDDDSRALIFNPIREVTELRSQVLYSNAALALPSNGSQVCTFPVSCLHASAARPSPY